jgi:hypothetical protein
MDRGGAGAPMNALLLLLTLAAAIQPQAGYSWHVAVAGESVEYGIPQTDDRGLRVTCPAGRGLHVEGPAGDAAVENLPTQIRFRSGEELVTMVGIVVLTGDGLGFSVPVGRDELPIRALLAGQPLTIERGELGWTVPGEGAAALIAPLVAACPAARN